MDIKEVIKRIEKAFPRCMIDAVTKICTHGFPSQEGWKISIIEPKKDDKE